MTGFALFDDLPRVAARKGGYLWCLERISMVHMLVTPISRPRISERLLTSASFPITLLVAPAGYGKSLAVRQFLALSNSTVAYFTAQREHSTLIGFLRGLTKSLKTSCPYACDALAKAFDAISSSDSPGADIAVWLSGLLESFVGTIVLDDLHVVIHDRNLTQFLVVLIERSQKGIKWILSSRTIAGLPTGTWLAYGNAASPIDLYELRFTIDETRIAAEHLGSDIKDSDLIALWTLTEGWPAAICFALRTSSCFLDVHKLAAMTREMIYKLLAEQVYAELSSTERELLSVATALPAVNIDILERAGFESALLTVERLRETTGFIHEESPRIYQCHDLFRDFIRHQSGLSGRLAQRVSHMRAAQALEASEEFGLAMTIFASCEARPDVLRLLKQHGFDLLERAHGDVVSSAIESLGEDVRRRSPHVLALRGALSCSSGQLARGEDLFRRGLIRAKGDTELTAAIALRLASVLANQGRDAVGILGNLARDRRQSLARRIEAFSLISGHAAVAGNREVSTKALENVLVLLPDLESEVVRAKALHHIGIAYHHLGVFDKACSVLSEAASLAHAHQLFSLAGRANAVLCNLALHHYDDVHRQAAYAERAADNAQRGGDILGLQLALLQQLSVKMRLGLQDDSAELECRIRRSRLDDLAERYLSSFEAMRLGWAGCFREAWQTLSVFWDSLPFEFDRMYCGSQLALFQALDGEKELSSQSLEVVEPLFAAFSANGLFLRRTTGISKALCALTHAINGRSTHGLRMLESAKSSKDGTVLDVAGAVQVLVSKIDDNHNYRRSVDLTVSRKLTSAGYADVLMLLQAIERSFDRKGYKLAPEPLLTRSELAVLRELAQGAVPKEIANRSGRSVNTVRVHIANVIAKLGCQGRAEAIRAAQFQGLI